MKYLVGAGQAEKQRKVSDRGGVKGGENKGF